MIWALEAQEELRIKSSVIFPLEITQIIVMPNEPNLRYGQLINYKHMVGKVLDLENVMGNILCIRLTICTEMKDKIHTYKETGFAVQFKITSE